LGKRQQSDFLLLLFEKRIYPEENLMNIFSETETEEIKICPLCESADSEFVFWNFDRLHSLPGKFGLVRCAECDFHRLSPRPAVEDLAAYYPADAYYSYQQPEDLSVFEKNANPRGVQKIKEKMRESVLQSYGYPVSALSAWQKILQPVFTKFFKERALYGLQDVFPCFAENGKALDIGCGNAETLAYLKLFGWQVAGVDFNEAAAVAAKRFYDIDVFVGRTEDAPFAPASFDFIRMSHVIEHLPFVVDSMRHIASLLKPNGVIYIETPNIEAFSFKQSREYWYPLECPRHLFLFSPKTLGALLEKFGLEVTKTETFFYDTYDWEDTYRTEENLGEKLEQRPQTSDPERAEKLKSGSREEHRTNPLCGDIIRLWGRKK
jgi:SAM-dependent methyltransferase